MTTGPLGILAALPEEIAGLIDRLEAPRKVETLGQREFHRGRLHGQDCVIALSRIGKVAAASTVTTLISRFDVSAVLFVGVAGGVGANVHVGDVVIATALIQHDMNAAPLFPRFEIPLLARARFETSRHWTEALQRAAQNYFNNRGFQDRANAIPGASVHCGLIASGDRFVSSSDEITALLQALPDLLAVDMESAAVGQVCHEYRVPVAILRSISDGANEVAAMSFAQFLTDVAAHYAGGILEQLLMPQTAGGREPEHGATN